MGKEGLFVAFNHGREGKDGGGGIQYKGRLTLGIWKPMGHSHSEQRKKISVSSSIYRKNFRTFLVFFFDFCVEYPSRPGCQWFSFSSLCSFWRKREGVEWQKILLFLLLPLCSSFPFYTGRAIVLRGRSTKKDSFFHLRFPLFSPSSPPFAEKRVWDPRSEGPGREEENEIQQSSKIKTSQNSISFPTRELNRILQFYRMWGMQSGARSLNFLPPPPLWKGLIFTAPLSTHTATEITSQSFPPPFPPRRWLTALWTPFSETVGYKTPQRGIFHSMWEEGRWWIFSRYPTPPSITVTLGTTALSLSYPLLLPLAAGLINWSIPSM